MLGIIQGKNLVLVLKEMWVTWWRRTPAYSPAVPNGSL